MKHILIAAALSLSASMGLAQDTRSFTDGAGNVVDIPLQAERIVSLRGEQFTAPLVELGAPIVGSTGNIIDGVNNGEPVIRGAYDLFHTRFTEGGITHVGTSTQPDFEAIASLNPDLILLPDYRAEQYDQLAEIAPTVIINIWSNSARERYRRIADAAGRLDRFEELQAVYDFRLNEGRALVEQMIGDPSKVSVAIAEVRDDRFRVYKVYGAMSNVLDELGFSKPELIENIDGERLDLSPEQVQLIDADFLVSSYAEHFRAPPAEISGYWDVFVPGWDQVLHAPKHNQHIFIAREPMRALSFQSMSEVLAIYLASIVTRDFVPFEG